MSRSKTNEPVPWLLGMRRRYINSTVTNVVLAACLVALMVENIRMRSEDQVRPYVIEVGPAGSLRVVEAKPLEVDTEDLVIRSTVAEVIRDLREVYSDRYESLRRFDRAFQFLRGDAASYVNQIYSQPGDDPRILARSMVRRVTIERVFEVDELEKTWRVEWVETMFSPETSGVSRREDWSAIVRVEQDPSHVIKDFGSNPLGIYVTRMDWSRRIGEETS